MQFPALTKKLLLFITIFLLCFSLFKSSAVFGQTKQVDSSTAMNTAPDVPKNLHTYTQSVMIEVLSALSCQLTGADPTTASRRCLGTDPKTGKIGYVDSQGLVGSLQTMIAVLYTPPAHLNDYTQYLSKNLGLTKPAYAATNAPCDPKAHGSGFCSITPLLPIWETFRNICYLLFVIVFILVGFAIMLRIKIDPRTVMSIENQIPKIIIALIIVTFSFAIAGFLIDVMFIFIYLLYGVIASIPGVELSSLNPSAMVGTNPLSAVGGFESGGVAGISWDASRAFGAIFADLFAHGPGGAWGKMFGTLFGFAVGGPILGTLNFLGVINIGSTILQVVGDAIAFIIIAIALIWALFRVWFSLLSSYLFILLDIVFAPFWIVVGVFPGGGLGFSLWLRDLIANLAAFPVVIVMLLLGRVFMQAFARVEINNRFLPPLIGNVGNFREMGALIGLGMILLTPGAVNMTKAALRAPKFDVKPIAAALGVGRAVTTNTVKDLAGDTFSYLQGNFPRPEEKGVAAVVRRILGKATV